jgi:hypothetical protein
MIFIKRSLYDTTKQLKDDFLEFPPKPIYKPSPRNDEFYKVYTTSITEKAYRSCILVRAIFGSEKNIDRTTEFGLEVINLRNNISCYLREFREQFYHVKKLITELPKLQKLFMSLVIITLSPLLAVIVILYGVILLLKMSRRAKPKKGTMVLGYFLPIAFNKRPEVVINKSTIKKVDISAMDGVISHEHIHMLQKTYFSSHNMTSRNHEAFNESKGELLRGMLKDPSQDFDYCKYYFLLDEMEARLHEVVLSFYRINKILPTNQIEFLEMLLSSEKIGALVKKYLEEFRESIPEGNYCSYKVRFDTVTWDIIQVLMCLKDKQTAMRYITEVLTVMYGNLLYLYGGEQESEFFMKTITNKDMYIELYE